MEKESNEKYLFTYKSKSTAEEYKKMVKYFPEMYWKMIRYGTILNLIYTAIIAILSKNSIETLTCFIIVQVIIMIIYKLRLENIAEKSFNTMKEKKRIDIEFHTEFFENYIVVSGETISYKIKYSDIQKFVETDTNFYLKYGIRDIVIIIQKNQCEIELMNFIREKFKKIEKNSENKKDKKYKNPNFIKSGMIILFIVTIASLWGALYSVGLVNNKLNPYGFNFTKTMWVFWCWLPIPILSIVLGFKYKNKGFKCTKNIVAGFIIGFFLLAYGAFCFFPTFEQDYSNIDDYRSIIDAKLPSNGVLEIMEDVTTIEQDKTEYTIINVYYDKENVKDLTDSIENSNNWILSKKIKSELKILIPSIFYADEYSYYSIYNKTLNEYNKIPNNEGNYEIYAMKYDKEYKTLGIHKFKYSYK